MPSSLEVFLLNVDRLDKLLHLSGLSMQYVAVVLDIRLYKSVIRNRSKRKMIDIFMKVKNIEVPEFNLNSLILSTECFSVEGVVS